MIEDELIKLARVYCERYHNGQTRRGGLPYATHPIAVAEILERYGYTDRITQCMALLHDVVEDTSIIKTEIYQTFGSEIATGVFILSRNTLNPLSIDLINRIIPAASQLSEESFYKLRLSTARKTTQRVKIADMIHNTTDLVNLRPTGVKRKINDARSFYLPMGEIIAPIMVKELIKNIEAYEELMKEKATTKELDSNK